MRVVLYCMCSIFSFWGSWGLCMLLECTQLPEGYGLGTRLGVQPSKACLGSWAKPLPSLKCHRSTECRHSVWTRPDTQYSISLISFRVLMNSFYKPTVIVMAIVHWCQLSTMQGTKALPRPEFLWLVPNSEPCHRKVGSCSHTVISHNACSILSHTCIMLGKSPCSVLLRCVRAPAPYYHSVFCIESHGTVLCRILWQWWHIGKAAFLGFVIM